MGNSTFLTRVVLENYRSIAACDVRLGPLTFLVGPNGSGKGNVLDGLRFVTDALHQNTEYAFRDRGGADGVLRRSIEHPPPSQFGIRLEFVLPSGATGHYALQVGVRSLGGYEVETEECVVQEPGPSGEATHFRVHHGVMDASVEVAPASLEDRLYLAIASGFPQFRPVYQAFSRMGFYNLDPDEIRKVQLPRGDALLARDGSNITGVLRRMREQDFAVIQEYLALIVPKVRGVRARTIGGYEVLECQEAAGAVGTWHFPAVSMSDGTLRALGVLVALFQAPDGEASRVPLVGIEEPELALHPAAAGVLLGSLREASAGTQVIVTSQSPDLLDNDEIDTDAILAVVAEDGGTAIGPLDDVGRSTLRDHLYTAGELLRLGQLRPDTRASTNGSKTPLHLFGD